MGSRDSAFRRKQRRRAIFWSMAYGVLYIAVHVLDIWYDPYLSDLQRESRHWTALVPAITIGMSTALLTLSFSMFITEEGFDVAMAAPSVLASVVIIYVAGQMAILLFGHVEIFAAAKYMVEPNGMVFGLKLWGAIASLSGLMSIVAGLGFLAILENYISRIMGLMQPRRGEHAQDHAERARLLWLMALLSIALTVLKYGLSALNAEGKNRLAEYALILEVAIFVFSIAVTLKGRAQAHSARIGAAAH